MSSWVTRPGAKAGPWPGEGDGRASPSRDGQARPHLHPGPPHRLQPICTHTDLELADPAGHLSQAPGCPVAHAASRLAAAPLCPSFSGSQPPPGGATLRAPDTTAPPGEKEPVHTAGPPASCGMGCVSVFSQLTPPTPRPHLAGLSALSSPQGASLPAGSVTAPPC